MDAALRRGAWPWAEWPWVKITNKSAVTGGKFIRKFASLTLQGQILGSSCVISSANDSPRRSLPSSSADRAILVFDFSRTN